MAQQWQYDREVISSMYLEKLYSIMKIAKIHGVGYKAVRNALIRANS
jgi:hypothetical protein